MRKTGKWILRIFLCLLLIALCAVAASAENTVVRALGDCGKDGNNLTWTLTDNGTLTISGSGEMKDYYKSTVSLLGKSRAPWYDYQTDIRSIVIENNVAGVGNYAFYGCERTLTVQLPQSLNRIGEHAFDTYGAITAVYYMAPIGRFGSIEIEGNNDRLLSASRHSHVSGGGTSSFREENRVGPTCTRPGGYDKVERCNYCDVELGRTWVQTASPIGNGSHTPGASTETVISPVSCLTPGLKRVVIQCSTCGETIADVTRTIPAPGSHTPGEPVIENEVPATCASDGGYDTVVYCTVCGEEISRVHSVTVPETHRGLSPNCYIFKPYALHLNDVYRPVEGGVDRSDGTGYHHYLIDYCGNCGKITYIEEHPVRIVVFYEKDYNENCDDWSRHYVKLFCDVCGYDDTVEVHWKNHDSITKTYRTDNRQAPTCTGDGYQQYSIHCASCEALYALMLQQELYQGQEPTILGTVDYDDTEIIPAIGHANAVTVPETEATETEHGYTEGVYCPDCDTWLSGHEVIHNTLGEYTYLDEYTEDGEQMVIVKCTVCGGEGLYAMEPIPAEPDAPEGGTNSMSGSPLTKAIQSIVSFFLRLIKWFSNMTR